MANGVLFFCFAVPVTELLRIDVCCFLILLPHQNKDLITASETHCLYNQDIISTKWQITVIIENRVEDF